jgi:multiple sugar transport system permease protein
MATTSGTVGTVGAGRARREHVRRRPRWQRALARNATAYLFLLPALLLFAMFLWWPIVNAFIISFQRVDLRNEPTWIGLDNFRAVINDPLFFKAWRNTLLFTVLALIFAYLIPVFLAIAINEVRWRDFFRLAFYLPAVLPPIVSLLLWRWVFDPGPGLANTALGWFGLPRQGWLQAADSVLPSILVITTWGGIGGAILYYMAALQGVPASLYDAAELDGANLLRRVRDITLPQIRGVMLLFLVGQVIATMQLFTEVFVLTGGGPNNASVTVMLLLYRYAFESNEFGKASALGVLIFLFLSAFSVGYLRLTFFKKS